MNYNDAISLIHKQAQGELRQAINVVIRHNEEDRKKIEDECKTHEHFARRLHFKTRILQEELLSLGSYAIEKWSGTNNTAYAAYYREKLDQEFDY